MPQQPESDQSRCQHRREQLLDAAATCFARDGFHGASIAQISKVAGMSPGHIYHFFASKEAIVAALVERRLERSLEIVQQFENAEDVFQAMLDRLDLGLNEKMDANNAALELEILAEAARNPRVAEIVRAADAAKRARLLGLLRSIRRVQGASDDGDEAAVEVLMALFEGLAARVVYHPGLEPQAVLPWLRLAMRALF